MSSLPVRATPTHNAERVGFSPARVLALVLRYLYLLRTSWPRIIELIYWPAVQMVTWGFLQLFITTMSGSAALGAGVFLGAMLLWDLLFRAQLGFSASFLEEMWSRNMGNLLMSPMRPSEFVAALMVMSLIRLAIGFVPVTLLAIPFFGFNLWGLGLVLAAFFVNLLLTAWAVALLVSGIVLRHGLGAEAFAWSLMFVMLPLVCVYYPVSLLPGWLQYVAWALPPTYVFEGMRAALVEHVFRADLMLWALAMNAVLIAGAALAFLGLLQSARVAGTLLQGE
jgi:ABC-2 type transport system permease protein